MLLSPTQQFCAAVSRMTASGTVGFFFFCWAAGLDAVLALAVGAGRVCSLTVALAVGRYLNQHVQ